MIRVDRNQRRNQVPLSVSFVTGGKSTTSNPAMTTQPLPLRKLLPPIPAIDSNANADADAGGCNKKYVRVYLIRHGQTDWNLEGRIQGGGFDVPLNETGKLQARQTAKALEGIPLDVVASSSMSRAKETADILMETILAGNNNNNNNNGSSNNNHHRLIRRFVDSGFDEMKFGALEGMRYTAITDQERYERFLSIKQKVADDPDYCFPGCTTTTITITTTTTTTSDDENHHDHDPWGETKIEREESFTNERPRSPTTTEGESTRIVQERSMGALSRVILDDGGSNHHHHHYLDHDHDHDPDNDTAVRHIAIVAHGRTNKILIAAMLHGEAHRRFREIQQGNVNISVLDYESTPKARSDEDAKEQSDTRGCWKSQLLNYTQHVEGMDGMRE